MYKNTMPCVYMPWLLSMLDGITRTPSYVVSAAV